MEFSTTGLEGAVLVDLEPHHDTRGFFARAFCANEFRLQGLPSDFPQSNLSRNTRGGTLRGLHFNAPPDEEAKLVRCVRGAIYDVIVDLRRESATFSSWIGVELSAENGRALFVPVGFAHGFLTLVDDTDIFYQMGGPYRPHAARGIRYNDPFFDVVWPSEPSVISERDLSYPDYDPNAP